jgi:hypothetical protein
MEKLWDTVVWFIYDVLLDTLNVFATLFVIITIRYILELPKIAYHQKNRVYHVQCLKLCSQIILDVCTVIPAVLIFVVPLRKNIDTTTIAGAWYQATMTLFDLLKTCLFQKNSAL